MELPRPKNSSVLYKNKSSKRCFGEAEELDFWTLMSHWGISRPWIEVRVEFSYVSLLGGTPRMLPVERPCTHNKTEQGWRKSTWRSEGYSTRRTRGRQKENRLRTLKRDSKSWNARNTNSSNGSRHYGVPE